MCVCFCDDDNDDDGQTLFFIFGIDLNNVNLVVKNFKFQFFPDNILVKKRIPIFSIMIIIMNETEL